MLLHTYPVELVDKIEALDKEVVPDFNSSECMYTRDQWYREVEKRQEFAFEEALDRLAREVPEEE